MHSPLLQIEKSIVKLSLTELLWLIERLTRRVRELVTNELPADNIVIEGRLPTQATLDEAIEFYQTDKCSLAKAADLAGITRWELQDVLYERGTPVEIYGPDSVAEMDARLEEMEYEGLLC